MSRLVGVIIDTPTAGSGWGDIALRVSACPRRASLWTISSVARKVAAAGSWGFDVVAVGRLQAAADGAPGHARSHAPVRGGGLRAI